ncbi:ABC transporter substrate-binding protein [Neisseriaceae bacterium TC5R-5]|nr:ABC transporter substrate-binding protein [Neisseriaceae bacterium TC5R-5]
MKCWQSVWFLLLCKLSLSAAYAADMNKTLRVAFAAPETGFDPAKMSDVYSLAVIDNIFDSLLSYDYLARPLKLVPNTIREMPQVSADGKVFTFRIRPGLYFSDDPVFKGQRRELTATDYAYSIKRFADPEVRSPTANNFTDFILGLAEAGIQARKRGGRFDYDAPIAGIKVLDRYTLQLRLKKTNFNMLYTLAAKNSGAVAREVIEAYQSNTNAHPVGSGPFLLKEWKPGSKIVLEANPGFRKVVFAASEPLAPADQELLKQLKGKVLPNIGRVEIRIIEEDQPRWLSFLNKQLDYSGIPKSALSGAITIQPGNPYQATLNPVLAERGIRLHRHLNMDVTYTFFNMRDPVVGGYSKDKIALRRAIALAYPKQEVIKLLYGNQAIALENLVPLGMFGNNPQWQGAPQYDPALANALLDKAGFKIGSDGYRRQPNGQPLLITQATQGSATDTQFNQIWQNVFDRLKIKVRFATAKWNENLKAAYAGKLQMWSLGGSASTPDGDDFVSGLWSGQIGQGNLAFFSLPAFDRAYEASQILANGPERQQLFDQMNRLVSAYQPYIYGVTRFSNTLSHRHVLGFKPHPIGTVGGSWMYMDLLPH